MGDAPYIVGLVVDPDYGERLMELASEMHVWVADTPTNTPIAQRIWAETTEPGIERGVTTFKIADLQDHEGNAMRELENIELHHGQYSHRPPVSVVEVVGVLITPPLKNAFEELGYTIFSETPEGFRATRPS
jgi:hypothetical protein